MLSPSIIAGRRARHGFDGSNPPGVDPVADRKRRTRRRAVEIVQWRCPVCDELHDEQVDAEDCCADQSEAEYSCPVCGAGHVSARTAADCCLWRDLYKADRLTIAQRVEGGATWLEAIGDVAGPLPAQLQHLIHEAIHDPA